ncbi:NXPE family member 1-like isoform X2 [Eleutherodactylus coqui]|uniref:NXPE family member 1-like isoform X2 n=1 Tax=Eleutherodactylus coqui TaxID=57060 RepID=UPI003462C877
MANTAMSKRFLALTVIIFLTSVSHHTLIKYFRPAIPMMCSTTEVQRASKIQMTIEKIFIQIDQRIPKINITDKSKATSAKNSKVYLNNPKDSYCVGDHLTVQVDVYDYLGKKKTYGGDYLRARISTPELVAGSSGRIEDFNNGTYHIHFILFWEGKVNINVLLMHPSEVASALWTSRNEWHGYVDHLGKFTKPGEQSEVICGFDLDKKQGLCEYKDVRDEELFYCVRHQNFSCESLSEVKSWWRNDRTLLTPVQKSLFDNIRVEIPRDFPPINVMRCNHSNTSVEERCKIGLKLEYPSGYAMKNMWYPKGCSTLTYSSLEELDKCLKGKFIHMFGDSIVRQWYEYMVGKIKTLQQFSLYEDNWSRQLFHLDIKRNMKMSWKRHTFPFISSSYQSWKEERTITREIDLIRGDKRTVIILTVGAHFRAYPIYYFTKRLYNIRLAIERLFLRSPETKVIIKTENTSEMKKNFETMSDFHAYVHYFIMEIIFKDLGVGFVNGWDMTNAFDTNALHPPEKVIANEVRMLMTYIC